MYQKPLSGLAFKGKSFKNSDAERDESQNNGEEDWGA